MVMCYLTEVWKTVPVLVSCWNSSDGPYCPYMIVHDKNGDGHDVTLKTDEDACFTVSGSPSKWTFKKTRCPKKFPKFCKDTWS